MLCVVEIGAIRSWVSGGEPAIRTLTTAAPYARFQAELT
jgi:hypothetical protein